MVNIPNRKVLEACVHLYVRYIRIGDTVYQGVYHRDARIILGEERYKKLCLDKIRCLGPNKDTVYPWNVVDWLILPLEEK